MRLSPLVVALALAASVASTSFGQSTEASAKLVGETPDATIEMMKRRATAKGATEADQIAALSVIASMSDHATEGVAEQSFTSIASATSVEQLNELIRGARLDLSAEDLNQLTEAGR